MADNTIKVIVTIPFEDDILKEFRNVSPRLEILSRPARSYTDIAAHIWEDAEVLYTANVFPPRDAMPRLRWIQSHWAGVEHVLEQPAVNGNPDVIVTTTRGIHATNMGEYALTMMLALARHLPALMQAQAKKEWAEDRHQRYEPLELRNATVGIVGYGAIGREVGRMAKMFGMQVLASKRNVKEIEGDDAYRVEGTGDPEGEHFDRLYPPQALATMVKDCDFVVLITPYTEKTKNMYSEKIIKAMKPGSYLINIGRGGVIDENALIEGLKSGHLAGAAMDVFQQEPLPQDSPLWTAPNLIITPHLAGSTADYNRKAAAVFLENLERYVQGKHLMNVVDREAGY